MDQPHPLQIQNSIVDASNNQILAMRSHVFLYTCSKISHLKFARKKSSIDDRYLLLLCGDIESHPGPDNINCYSLRHPSMCPFFRTAVYMVFNMQMLLPKSERDNLVSVDIDQGFADMKNLFQGHFEANLVDFPKLKKNIQRFKQKNKDWGRDDCASRDEYYHTFRPAIWVQLSESEKLKHSLDCKQCPKTHAVLMAKFPSSSNSVHQGRIKNPVNVSKTAKGKLKKKEKAGIKACFNEVLENLNRSWEDVYNESFDSSFEKYNNFAPKPTREENRQRKKAHFKQVTEKIQVQDEKTMVDRCFGARISLNAWNRERKKRRLKVGSKNVKITLGHMLHMTLMKLHF